MLLLMQPSILLSFFAAAARFTRIEPVVYQDPQVPFHRAAPKLGGSQPVLHSWIMFSRVQDLTFVFTELHKILVNPLFQPIQIFLQGGSPFQSVHFRFQFGIIGKFLQGTLDLMIQITDEDNKQRWAQYQSLGDPTGDWLPVWKGAIYRHPLGVQPISQFPTHSTDHLSRP